VNLRSTIGTHIGAVVSQNAKGDLLGHVFDRGYAEYRGRSDIRGSQTRAALEFSYRKNGWRLRNCGNTRGI
jgi:hypothetical protein